MEHLDDISVEELHDALAEAGEAKATRRLVAAIAHKNGVPQTELAEWYDVERKTIYNWLERFDTDDPLAAAATDAHRSGRKRKLSEQEQSDLARTVRAPPAAAGLDEPAWTPALLRRYLADAYGVEYSLPSCRRLLKEAGLSYRGPSPGDGGICADQLEEVQGEHERRERRWTPR